MTLRQSSCWMLQDGTYICPVGKFVVEEMGSPEEVEGGPQEGNNTATGPPSAPVQEGTEGALPKPYKTTFIRSLSCMFLPQVSETDFMMVACISDIQK